VKFCKEIWGVVEIVTLPGLYIWTFRTELHINHRFFRSAVWLQMWQKSRFPHYGKQLLTTKDRNRKIRHLSLHGRNVESIFCQERNLLHNEIIVRTIELYYNFLVDCTVMNWLATCVRFCRVGCLSLMNFRMYFFTNPVTWCTGN